MANTFLSGTPTTVNNFGSFTIDAPFGYAINTGSKTPIKLDGLFGKTLYQTDYLPKEWTRGFSSKANGQELADYLLQNTIDSDPRVTRVINEHFWDF